MMFVTVKLSDIFSEDLKQLRLSMSGLTALISRIKKCQNLFQIQNTVPKRSVVFMDRDGGELLWEEGVDYNESGILAVPLPMSIDDWEMFNEES